MAMLNFGLIHIWVLAHYSFQKENGVMFGVKEQMVDWLRSGKPLPTSEEQITRALGV